MSRFILSLLGLLVAACLATAPAHAQNITCPTAPMGTVDNRCASTEFVHNAVVTVPGLTVGTTNINNGSTGRVLLDNSGILGEIASSTIVNGQTCILGGSCTISAASSGVVIGTTTVGGATNGNVLYNNSGVLGQLSPATTVNTVSCTLGGSCTVTAAAGTLTGTTLNPTVVTSSLTSVGTLAGLTVTSSFTATGLVTNADLVNAATTVNGQTCTLGSTCTVPAVTSVSTGTGLTGGTITTTGTISLAAISADNVLLNATGGSAAPTGQTVGNCATALTYSTSGHAFGCNGSVGSGTVTSIATNNGITGGTITTTGTIGLAAIAADNLLLNATGGSAAPTAQAVPTCSATASALTYNTGTHAFGCLTDNARLSVADQTLSGGANVTSANLGTVTSGTTTIDCGTSPLQYLTDGGAFTLAAPSNDGSCLVKVTNNGSAGTITLSGFTVGSNTGAALDTTNAHIFTISIWRINSTSAYTIFAHQ